MGVGVSTAEFEKPHQLYENNLYAQSQCSKNPMQVRCVHLQQAIGGIAHENAYQAQQQGGREAGVDSAQSDLAETGRSWNGKSEC